MGQQILQPFLNCKGLVGRNGTVLEYQFNQQYDLDNDIWYADTDDFKSSEWKNQLSINTEDGTVSNNSRAGVEFRDYTEVLENTIKEEYASAFLKRLFIESVSGEEHFAQLLSYGLNVRMTTYFGDGSYVRQTYKCVTVVDHNTPFQQMSSSEAEVTLNTHLNFEPETINVGLGVTLPTNMVDASVVATVTKTPTEITVALSNLIDPNALVLTPDSFQVTLFDKDGNIVNAIIDEIGGNFVFTGLTTGEKYTVAVGYKYLVLNTIDYYKYINAQEVQL